MISSVSLARMQALLHCWLFGRPPLMDLIADGNFSLYYDVCGHYSQTRKYPDLRTKEKWCISALFLKLGPEKLPSNLSMISLYYLICDRRSGLNNLFRSNQTAFVIAVLLRNGSFDIQEWHFWEKLLIKFKYKRFYADVFLYTQFQFTTTSFLVWENKYWNKWDLVLCSPRHSRGNWGKTKLCPKSILSLLFLNTILGGSFKSVWNSFF